MDNWFEIMCEVLFKVKSRGSSFNMEVYYGVVHFISCSYVLAVAPQQLQKAGYGYRSVVVAIGLTCGLGSVLGGLITNLPFVLAPPTVVSIFLSVYLQSNAMTPAQGNAAVILSAICLMCLFWRPLGQFVAKLIPLPIQVGTVLGVGLLTALAGSSEIHLVERGNQTILQVGKVTSEVMISLAGIIIICITSHYNVKGGFCVALIVCSLVSWMVTNDWPSGLAASPAIEHFQVTGFNNPQVGYLTCELLFLYILYLNGLTSSLSELAHLKRDTDGTTPRSRWLFVLTGIITVLAGFVSSAPVLLSPESAAAIKSGAKTGLSTLVCGLLFLTSTFFTPIFEAVPAAGTSPLLIMIGVILFQEVNRLNWKNISDSAPAFMVLFFIPFTYSIICGVAIGYIVYLTTGLFTGVLFKRISEMLSFYYPPSEHWFRPLSRQLDSTTNTESDIEDHGDSHYDSLNEDNHEHHTVHVHRDAVRSLAHVTLTS